MAEFSLKNVESTKLINTSTGEEFFVDVSDYAPPISNNLSIESIVYEISKTMFPIPNYLDIDFDRDMNILFIRINIMYEDFDNSWSRITELDGKFNDKHWYGAKIIPTLEKIK